jgi:hypothetical protein
VVLSSGIKQPGCQTDHSPPSSAEVIDEQKYTPTSFMCLPVVDRVSVTYSLPQNIIGIIKSRCMRLVGYLARIDKNEVLIIYGMKSCRK